MSVSGKVAVVFGGARGIGQEYVRVLLQAGAKVCFSDILEINGQETLEEFQKTFGDHVRFVMCDVTKDQDVNNVFEEAASTLGPVEICVNSAGICKEKDWWKTVEVNFGGAVRTTYAAFRHMGTDAGGRGGVVVQTASVNALLEQGPHQSLVFKTLGYSV